MALRPFKSAPNLVGGERQRFSHFPGLDRSFSLQSFDVFGNEVEDLEDNDTSVYKPKVRSKKKKKKVVVKNQFAGFKSRHQVDKALKEHNSREKEARLLFAHYDMNNDGSIDRFELQRLLQDLEGLEQSRTSPKVPQNDEEKVLGRSQHMHVVQQHFDRMDVDGDGEITFQEFQQQYQKVYSAHNHMKEILQDVETKRRFIPVKDLDSMRKVVDRYCDEAESHLITLAVFRKLIVDADMLTWEFTRSDVCMLFDTLAHPPSHYDWVASSNSGANTDDEDQGAEHGPNSNNDSPTTATQTKMKTKTSPGGTSLPPIGSPTSVASTPSPASASSRTAKRPRAKKHGTSSEEAKEIEWVRRQALEFQQHAEYVLDFGDFYSQAVPLIAAKTFAADYRVNENKACAAVIHRLGNVDLGKKKKGGKKTKRKGASAKAALAGSDAEYESGEEEEEEEEEGLEEGEDEDEGDGLSLPSLTSPKDANANAAGGEVGKSTALFNPENERLQVIFTTCCGYEVAENTRVGKLMTMSSMAMTPRKYINLLRRCCLLNDDFDRSKALLHFQASVQKDLTMLMTFNEFCESLVAIAKVYCPGDFANDPKTVSDLLIKHIHTIVTIKPRTREQYKKKTKVHHYRRDPAAIARTR